MDHSPNLELPYIAPAQAQKHVTHNEAVRMLDALVQLGVIDRDLAAPPVSPAQGDRYIVATGSTGAWASRDGCVAFFADGGWFFLEPRAGWIAWVADEAILIAFDGTAWTESAAASVNPVAMVGVNTTATTTNRLAVKSPLAARP